jgi:hypothetical protein
MAADLGRDSLANPVLSPLPEADFVADGFLRTDILRMD